MKNTKDKTNERGIFMTAALLEKERVEYISEMKTYIKQVKNLPKTQARKVAIESLHNVGIVTQKGEFTAHYRNNLKD